MKIKQAFVGLLLILLIIAATLAACNMPTRRNQSAATAQTVYTQSAATIIAQLTGIAEGNFPPSPTGGAETSSTPSPGTTISVTTVTPPTPLITPTETVTPPSISATLTATLTVILAGSDPRTSLGEPDWIDQFKNDFYWAPYEDDHVRFWLRENSMLMRAKGAENRDSWMLSGEKPQDYYLEMTAQPQACAGLDRYGFIVRSDAETGYLFGFSCDGQYSVRKWDGDNFTALIDWTSSPSILAGAGQDNRLGVMAVGEDYKIYANGKLLGEVADDSFSGGRFGLFVAGKDTEDFTTRVKEVAYWELPR